MAQKQQPESSINLTKVLPYALAIVAIVVTYFCYIPAQNNQFVNWDDEAYVVDNYDIDDFSAKNIRKQFKTFRHGNYHPFTMISLMYDHSKVKKDPKRYHMVNIYLHCINTLLVFLLVYLMAGRAGPAFVVSLLFGIHPMHVESVAWVSERKDVLYTMFYLGGLVTYVKYLTQEKMRGLWLGLTVILFVCSCFSKPAALAFTPLLFAFDYYYQRQINIKLFLEKIPFVIITGFFLKLAFDAQNDTESIASMDTFTLWEHVQFASYGIMAYLGKLVYPMGLSNFHPYPHLIGENFDRLDYIYPTSVGMVAVLGGLMLFWFKRHRLFVFSFVFYLINLAMVLQIVSVGNAIIAERYSYVPYIGIFFLIAMLMDKWWQAEDKPRKMASYVVIGVIAAGSLFMIGKTREQADVWTNSETLWTNFLKNYPNESIGYNSRGTYYVKNNKVDLAFNDFQSLAKLDPTAAKPHVAMANIWGMRQQFDKALASYDKAIKRDSTFFEAYLNRAITLSMMQKYGRAIQDYNRAAELDSTSVPIYQNRSHVYLTIGDNKAAIKDLTVLIRVYPRTMSYLVQRGTAYLNDRQLALSEKDLSNVLKVQPKHKQALHNLAICYFEMGKFKLAKEKMNQAKALGMKVNQGYFQKIMAKG